ncbi:MAG: sigma-70 family RNA polymerase sigma factor [Armatimonadota bacterium]
MITRMQAGSAAAFAEFVDAYGRRVQSLARRYTRTTADAEDLTQDIFVDICRGIRQFRGESSLGTWVYRVALNHCLKAQGRSRPETVELEAESGTPSEEGNPQRHLARRELADKVDDALFDLTSGHRDVVILHELHGLTYAECAAILGIPVGTVKSRLSNAFGRLRTRLSDYVLGSEPVTPHPETATAAPPTFFTALPERAAK